MLGGTMTAAGAHADEAGERIYRLGLLPSGEPLRAEREAGMGVEGAVAACVNCHRRSGLGMKEGRRTIPPIAGRYLFHPRAAAADELDLPYVEGMRADREPYTDETLARAIRTGIDADGRPLSYLMPHFQLDDAQMSSLIAYLRRLAPAEVPGVTPSALHFATIITPEADPAVAKGVIEVLEKFFDDKNHYTRAESPRLHSSRRMMFKVNRRWALNVWQLTGAPETWEAQLRAKLAATPVFAVISGVGGHSWAPVHHFCEAAELPCLFPNVDLPVDRESDFDTLYLSKGVLLEAQLLAQAIRDRQRAVPVSRVVQIFRAGDVGVEAAAALDKELHQSGLRVVNRSLGARATQSELRERVGQTGPGELLVLWLRAPDLAALALVPPHDVAAYMSGRMGGLEHAPLPAAWRAATHMSYPFNLPDRRRVQMDYPLGWFRMRQIPIVAEQAQTDTYLVCAIVSETINHMVDTFVRDYLVERVEEMLEHRLVTGYYPRLALAPGQRFASKGGYIVHFTDSAGTRVSAEGDWTVPLESASEK
ncbi:MAG: c-type cytochrome [Gammaproteobacteria bacterium]|nr:c-type cytochrome [Gammaproteobacteria bacterium]MDE2250644.1 c-type cytochrome [Gammaproteobacteria bacterium]